MRHHGCALWVGWVLKQPWESGFSAETTTTIPALRCTGIVAIAAAGIATVASGLRVNDRRRWRVNFSTAALVADLHTDWIERMLCIAALQP
jgi:hypothetical protein